MKIVVNLLLVNGNWKKNNVIFWNKNLNKSEIFLKNEIIQEIILWKLSAIIM